MGETAKQICRAAVEGKLADWDWQLVPNLAVFIQGICDELALRFGPSPDPAQPESIRRAATLATIRKYGPLLFEACIRSQTDLQNRAFAEISAYLYRLALTKTPNANVAQDCTQQGLETIWRRLNQVRDPGAFLYWCKKILLNHIADYYRETPKEQEEGGTNNADTNEENSDSGQPGQAGDANSGVGQAVAPDPFENVMRAQMREQLITALGACLGNLQHVRVVIRVLLEDLGYGIVAAELGTTPLNVQVMKSRAIAKLRTCDQVLNLYEQWFRF